MAPPWQLESGIAIAESRGSIWRCRQAGRIPFGEDERPECAVPRPSDDLRSTWKAQGQLENSLPQLSGMDEKTNWPYQCVHAVRERYVRWGSRETRMALLCIEGQPVLNLFHLHVDQTQIEDNPQCMGGESPLRVAHRVCRKNSRTPYGTHVCIQKAH